MSLVLSSGITLINIFNKKKTMPSFYIYISSLNTTNNKKKTRIEVQMLILKKPRINTTIKSNYMFWRIFAIYLHFFNYKHKLVKTQILELKS